MLQFQKNFFDWPIRRVYVAAVPVPAFRIPWSLRGPSRQPRGDPFWFGGNAGETMTRLEAARIMRDQLVKYWDTAREFAIHAVDNNGNDCLLRALSRHDCKFAAHEINWWMSLLDATPLNISGFLCIALNILLLPDGREQLLARLEREIARLEEHELQAAPLGTSPDSLPQPVVPVVPAVAALMEVA